MNPLEIQSISPNGDCAMIIRFRSKSVSPAGIHALAEALIREPLPDQLNVIPTSDSLVLVFARPVVYTEDWLNELRQIIIRPRHWPHEPVIHEWPVCYDASLAPDLAAVTRQLGCTAEQLIEWHGAPLYRVSQLGFLPGFVYLDGNPESVNVPRKSSPALSVPAGSVAIAGQQTGVYALSTPGGWQVIGRTPARILDLAAAEPMGIRPLDQVRFVSVSVEQFKQLSQASCN
jgi:inhibitor of KinA